jgi:hypothetical protein
MDRLEAKWFEAFRQERRYDRRTITSAIRRVVSRHTILHPSEKIRSSQVVEPRTRESSNERSRGRFRDLEVFDHRIDEASNRRSTLETRLGICPR